MADLFRRDIAIEIGSLVIQPRDETGAFKPLLHVSFDIEKTDVKDPNTATLRIWNLNAQNRSKLQQQGLSVVVLAGYVGRRKTIFKGDTEKTTITRDATDWITEVECGDGSKQLKKARTNQSFRGGQSLGKMIEKLAGDLGLDVGNIKEKIASDGARSVLKEFVSGFVASGKTSDVLDELAKSAGLKFSVQDGSVTLLAKTEVLPGPAVPVDSTSGLIGTPQIGEKGIVTARMLLNGEVVPGKKVTLSSAAASGSFVTRKVKHTGSTWGGDWLTEVEMGPI